jgi:hypothetical protein
MASIRRCDKCPDDHAVKLPNSINTDSCSTNSNFNTADSDTHTTNAYSITSDRDTFTTNANDHPDCVRAR